MKASQEALDDIRANIGHVGYPGGCPTCKFESELGRNGHRQTPGPDTITCVKCGEIGKAADHNHILCWECEGVAHIRRRNASATLH